MNFLVGGVSRGDRPATSRRARREDLLSAFCSALRVRARGRGSRRFSPGSGTLFLVLCGPPATFDVGVQHALFAFPFSPPSQRVRREGLALPAAPSLPPLVAFRRSLCRSRRIATSTRAALVLQHPRGQSRPAAASSSTAISTGVRTSRGSPRRRARISREPLPALVWSGDLVERHPSLRRLRAADVERPGQLLAIGETPFAIGPEFYAARGDGPRPGRSRPSGRRSTRAANESGRSATRSESGVSTGRPTGSGLDFLL